MLNAKTYNGKKHFFHKNHSPKKNLPRNALEPICRPYSIYAGLDEIHATRPCLFRSRTSRRPKLIHKHRFTEGLVAGSNASIAENQVRIQTDTESIDGITTQIRQGTSGDNIDANTVNIGMNADSIQTNKAKIGTNADSIQANMTGISTNARNIPSNTASIGVNTNNIQSNTASISAVSRQISQHTEAVLVTHAQTDQQATTLTDLAQDVEDNTDNIQKINQQMARQSQNVQTNTATINADIE